MIETCQLCGRASHETKSMRDQCRLFTAILGRGWGVMRHLGEKSCSDSESEEDMFITPDTSFSEEWATMIGWCTLISIKSPLSCTMCCDRSLNLQCNHGRICFRKVSMDERSFLLPNCAKYASRSSRTRYTSYGSESCSALKTPQPRLRILSNQSGLLVSQLEVIYPS